MRGRGMHSVYCNCTGGKRGVVVHEREGKAGRLLYLYRW